MNNLIATTTKKGNSNIEKEEGTYHGTTKLVDEFVKSYLV